MEKKTGYPAASIPQLPQMPQMPQALFPLPPPQPSKPYRNTFAIPMVVQGHLPRDFFEDCTLTLEQWLGSERTFGRRRLPTDDGDAARDRVAKMETLVRACASVCPMLAHWDEELRQEPQVGYDVIGDQTVFIFKADNNGNSYLVSEHGVRTDDVNIMVLSAEGYEGGSENVGPGRFSP